MLLYLVAGDEEARGEEGRGGTPAERV